MSDEANNADARPFDGPDPEAPAGVEDEKDAVGTGDFTTELDPTLIPDESGETPEEKRARENPEATGS